MSITKEFTVLSKDRPSVFVGRSVAIKRNPFWRTRRSWTTGLR
jgi:hypothetical protein